MHIIKDPDRDPTPSTCNAIVTMITAKVAFLDICDTSMVLFKKNKTFEQNHRGVAEDGW